MADVGPRRNLIELAGGRAIAGLSYVGGMALLLGRVGRCIGASLLSRRAGFRGRAFCEQVVRVALRSVGIVVLVQMFIGVILVLQMTPPLEPWGQVDKVANIIGVAGFRMLGPIITAVVLSGFAGASIAAELGTMVVAEEIEALEAIGLNPVRFLVVPRVLATVLGMVLLTVISDVMIALGGYLTSMLLGPLSHVGYWDRMRDQLRYNDFVTGLIQAAVFGLLISTIACHEGLKVRGGAEGVGRATTMTVVHSVVAIVLAACLFAVVFYVYKW